MKLGVNIDHIALLREARQVNDPNILQAMFEAVSGGADQITIHLREDRRHIDEFDFANIIKHCPVPVNLECSIDESNLKFISEFKPHRVTLVPEKREELTTEGGLDLDNKSIKNFIQNLPKDTEISLFVEPKIEVIDKAKELGAQIVELHTGAYANLFLAANSSIRHTKYYTSLIGNYPDNKKDLQKLLQNKLVEIKEVAKFAINQGILVAAGHGLNYQNVKNIAKIDEIFELNIGQSIVARSIFAGLKNAVCEMKNCIQ